jgi:hypothetical protein
MGQPPDHASVTRGRVGIQFTLLHEPFDAHSYPGWFYFFVEGIDALANEYSERNVTFTRPIRTEDHGMREFEVSDVNRFRLRFGQYA